MKKGGEEEKEGEKDEEDFDFLHLHDFTLFAIDMYQYRCISIFHHFTTFLLSTCRTQLLPLADSLS